MASMKAHLHELHSRALMHHGAMVEHFKKAAECAKDEGMSACMKACADEHQGMMDFHRDCAGDLQRAMAGDDLEKLAPIAGISVVPTSDVPRSAYTAVPRTGQPQINKGDLPAFSEAILKIDE